MLIKSKKKWLSIIVVSLGILNPNVAVSGIPVIDYTAIAQMVQNALVTAQNWKRNFEEMMRGKFGNLQDSSFKSNDPYTKDKYIKLIDKMQQQCNKISYPVSKDLCIDVYNIDKQKVELFYSSMEDIDKATAALNAAVQNQRTQSGSGQAQTAENEVQIKLDNLKRIMDIYEHNLKALNVKQEFMQNARVKIAREQMLGSNLIAKSFVTGIVAGTIQKETRKSLEKKIKELRDNNNTVSDSEFNKHSKFYNK